MSNLPEIKVRKVTIGEVFKVSSGGTPSRKIDEYFTDGNIAWVKTGDLKGKFVTVATEFISQLGLDNSSAKVFPPKTVLLAMYGATIGACSILPFAAATNQACAAILPSDDCNEIFLYYYLLFIKPSLINKGVGGAQPNISAGLIKNLEIPIPPLTEQQKIASILDAADSLRQKDQQLIKKYAALSQSLFLEMFGDPVSNPMEWDRKTIRDLVSEVKYGTSSKAEDDGKYPYLRMNNITYQGYMNFDSLKYINVTDKDKEKYVVKKGDILFNRTNSKELVGKTGLYNENTEMIIAGYLIRVRTNEFSNPYYIWAYLNSIHGKLILTNMCKSIVGMANINAQELQDIKILIPPIILQTQFAERILAIEAQKLLALASLEKSVALFNSLLQRAFKGELTT